MSMIRIVLVTGIVLFASIIWFVLSDDNVDSVAPVQNDIDTRNSSDSNNQDFTPILNPGSREFELKIFAETPDGYDVTRLPSDGLVNTIVSPNPTSAFDQVLSELYLDTFLEFECMVPGRQNEQSLVITTKPDQNGTDQSARQAIMQWEPFMARDIGVTLYPNLQPADFAETVLDFSDVGNDQLAAQFNADGSVRNIYYGWVLNYVVFATSKNCLTTTINDIYAPQAH